MNTSEALNRAADLVQERGWKKGPSGWGWGEASEQLCIEGGIMAALGLGVGTRHKMWTCPAYNAVADYLSLPPLGCQGQGAFERRVWLWNDTVAESASDVIEVLRACAVIEASREREPAQVSA